MYFVLLIYIITTIKIFVNIILVIITTKSKMIHNMRLYNEKEIFELSLDIGEAMIKSGGEIKRAENSIERINKSAGAKSISVWAIPSMIIASVTGKSGSRYTSVKRIDGEMIDLTGLDSLNNLSRRLCSGEFVDFNIEKGQVYPLWLQIICTYLATSAFCLYFGGTLLDTFFAGMTGILISYYRGVMRGNFSSVLLDSIVAGMLSFMPRVFGLLVAPDKIMIGTIMLLVPGLTVGNAMRDMISGDIFAGVMRLIDAVLTALAIAFGFSIAVLIFGSDYL